MKVHSVAITGASGLVGRHLLPVLAEHPLVERVLGLDVREPERLPHNAEFQRVDVARTELAPLLEGIDVVVHLAGVVDPIPDEGLMARINVEGTRRVLDAAASAGIHRVVRISSATVYGAWPNNAVPLAEDAPLRPNPTFSPAVQGAEVERILSEWRAEHPGVTVTTLRSAPVAGPGAERLPARILLGRPALRVRGAAPLLQVVHVDDLVAALALVATTDLPGVYNVAADGWLTADEARALLPRSRMPAVPAEALERALRRTWRLGLGDVPPGVVPYLVHPWVLANDKLVAHGWRPRHRNEDTIREALASLPPRGRFRSRALAGAVIALALVVARRRRSRQRVSAATKRSSSSSVL
ncbi:MAG TPA: NAD-dependent epimerase/dehydratase family protein [Acidimicrobiia bacterium]